MPKKMRTTRNLLLMATLLGSALFARAADKEMTIGAIYLDTQGYYAGVRQGVQDAAKDSSVQVQLIETNAQGDISKESTFVDTLVARNVDAIILLPTKLTSRKLPSSIAKPLKFVCSDVKDLKKY